MLKRQHQIFIDEMIKGASQQQAYKAAYPKASDATADKESYRLLRNPTISQAIKDNADKIRAIATQEAITALKDEIHTNILTAAKKREILHQIATGELEVERIVPTKDGFKRIKSEPDHYERMKAIEIDNKMSGDNAPDRIETKTVLDVFVQPEDDGN